MTNCLTDCGNIIKLTTNPHTIVTHTLAIVAITPVRSTYQTLTTTFNMAILRVKVSDLKLCICRGVLLQ